MQPEIFAEFLKRLGHRIIKTESCYWYNAQPGFYFYFPYHKLINPSWKELNKLGRFYIGGRFFTMPESKGKDSYLLVCDDKNYDIGSVASSNRRQTRRGLEHFEIEQIDFKYLQKFGQPLVHDTLTRQGRNLRIWSKKRWSQYCLATIGLDGFEAWGAFSHGKLAAFIMAFLMENHFTILHHYSLTSFLPFYPNNALVFSFTKNKLSSSEVSSMFYGPESLDAPDSVDVFKVRMGYTKRPIKQRIFFNSAVKPFINPFTQKMIQWIVRRQPSSDMWRKLEGVIKFYQEAS